MMCRQFATRATTRMPDRGSASRPDFGALATAVLDVTAPMKEAYSSSPCSPERTGKQRKVSAIARSGAGPLSSGHELASEEV